MRLLGQRQKSTASAIARTSAFTVIPQIVIPMVRDEQDLMMAAHTVVALQKRNPEHKKPKSFILAVNMLELFWEGDIIIIIQDSKQT